MNLFSKDKENTKRQEEIDLLRGFTALILIICHVGIYLGSSSDTGLYVFSDIIGSEFAAPVLMALMGISINYSRHSEPKDLFKRGVYLFILGYILNFLRSILPLLVFGNINEWTSIEAFFVVDIMQFAGLSFILLSLFKKLKLKSYIILTISIVMVVVDQFIMLPEEISWDSEVLTGIVNLFCPVSSWSCFPLLTWFFFPAFGLFFGELLVRCKNKKILYFILLLIGLVGVLYEYITFYILYPNYNEYYFGNNFYYMGIWNVIVTCCFIVFALSFWYFMSKITPNFIKKYLCFLSKNLNAFYIISWLIIGLLIHLKTLLNWNISDILTIGLMVILNILCSLTTFVYAKIKETVKNKKEN